MTWAPWNGSGFPARFPARLAVAVTNGTTLDHAIDDVGGGPARPFDRAMMLASFRDNARRKLTAEAVEQVAAEIESIETATDLRALTKTLRQLA